MAPGHLTPHVYESLVDLGTWMPFAKAAPELNRVLGVTVSEPTARRYAEGAGAASRVCRAQKSVRIEKMLPRGAGQGGQATVECRRCDGAVGRRGVGGRKNAGAGRNPGARQEKRAGGRAYGRFVVLLRA